MPTIRQILSAASGLFLIATALPASAQGGAITPGTYQCVAAGGIAGQFKMAIKNGKQYVNSAGKSGNYSYDAGTSQIVFETGPLEGMYGRRISASKIGLTSRKGGPANTVCDLK